MKCKHEKSVLMWADSGISGMTFKVLHFPQSVYPASGRPLSDLLTRCRIRWGLTGRVGPICPTCPIIYTLHYYKLVFFSPRDHLPHPPMTIE